MNELFSALGGLLYTYLFKGVSKTAQPTHENIKRHTKTLKSKSATLAMKLKHQYFLEKAIKEGDLYAINSHSSTIQSLDTHLEINKILLQ